MTNNVHMNEELGLTPKEKKLLKEKIYAVFDEFPIALQERILETKKEKLKTMYMTEGWARDNGHDEILNLLSREIAKKEWQIDQLNEKINGK